MQLWRPRSTGRTLGGGEVALSSLLRRLLCGKRQQGTTLGNLFSQAGRYGFGVVLMLLALPSALPIPAPGYSAPFGVCIALISLQMLAGRKQVWLPERAARVQLSGAVCTTTIEVGSRLFDLVDGFVCSRWHFVQRRSLRIFVPLVALSMAILMIIPIPMTNTLPALVIFMLGAGVAAQDGLAVLFAIALALVAFVLFTALVSLGLSLL